MYALLTFRALPRTQNTHIYAFDFDFVPPVMRHIGGALRNTREWRVFASCSDMRDWAKLWE